MKEPTQQYSDTIKSLQSRIQALEDENRLLKERLEEAGVSYADIVSGDAEGVVELYDPDQGARIKKFDVTDKIASDFFMMFCRGRKDVYDLRYTNPKTGKNGYYTQCFNRWDRGCHIQKKDGVRCKDCELRAYKPVTLPLIKAHMNGTDPNGNLPESVREPNYAMEDFVRRMIKSLGVESVICKELFTVLSEKKYDYFYDGNCDLEDFINRSK